MEPPVAKGYVAHKVRADLSAISSGICNYNIRRIQTENENAAVQEPCKYSQHSQVSTFQVQARLAITPLFRSHQVTGYTIIAKNSPAGVADRTKKIRRHYYYYTAGYYYDRTTQTKLN